VVSGESVVDFGRERRQCRGLAFARFLGRFCQASNRLTG
jgi:hypothetical protein